MKTKTAYETSDGTLHKTEDEAKEHEKSLNKDKKLKTFIENHTKDCFYYGEFHFDGDDLVDLLKKFEETLNTDDWINEADRMEKDRDRMAVLISKLFKSIDHEKCDASVLMEASEIASQVMGNDGRYC